MALVIGDEVLREANLSEADARVEIACRFYAAERLSFESAIQLAGLGPSEFSTALATRGISRRESNGLSLDDQYAAGYERIPEDASETAALQVASAIRFALDLK